MILPSELVPDRQRADELLLGEQRRGELVAEGVGVDRGEDRVELVRADLREQLLLRALDEVDRDARVLVVEVGDDRVEVVQAGRPHAAEAQVAAQQAGHLVELVAQPVDLVEHPARVVEDERPLGRQLDAAAGPREERDAELGLEPAELLRDGRLGEVQLLAGLRERAVARDRDDRPEVSKLHADKPRTSPSRSRSRVRGDSDHPA